MDYWTTKLAASGCQRIDFPGQSTSLQSEQGHQITVISDAA